MKALYILILIATITLFTACSPEEVINSSEQNMHILAVLAKSPGCLTSIKMPTATVEHQDLLSRAGIAVTGNPISAVRFYMNRTYVAVPADKKIYVLSDSNYAKLAEIDFSGTGDEPTDICFPNSTYAYVLSTSTNSVSFVDTYSDYKIVKRINVGKRPSAINCYTNQVFVANYDDNTVSVIDTRTNEVSRTISTADCPAFVEIIPEVSRMLVVCRGKGKDSDVAKTDAVAHIYDLQSMTLKKDVPLAKGNFTAVQQNPVSVASSQTGLAFILCGNYIFRLETVAGVKLDLYKKIDAKYVNYSRWLDQLLIVQNVSNKPVLTFNTTAAAEESSKMLPDTALMAFPVR